MRVYHFHLERKPLSEHYEAVHCFLIRVDQHGAERREEIFDVVLNRHTSRAVETVIEKGIAELGGRFTRSLDPRATRR